jgi:hypothetical protein
MLWLCLAALAFTRAACWASTVATAAERARGPGDGRLLATPQRQGAGDQEVCGIPASKYSPRRTCALNYALPSLAWITKLACL